MFYFCLNSQKMSICGLYWSADPEKQEAYALKATKTGLS